MQDTVPVPARTRTHSEEPRRSHATCRLESYAHEEAGWDGTQHAYMLTYIHTSTLMYVGVLTEDMEKGRQGVRCRAPRTDARRRTRGSVGVRPPTRLARAFGVGDLLLILLAICFLLTFAYSTVGGREWVEPVSSSEEEEGEFEDAVR